MGGVKRLLVRLGLAQDEPFMREVMQVGVPTVRPLDRTYSFFICNVYMGPGGECQLYEPMPMYDETRMYSRVEFGKIHFEERKMEAGLVVGVDLNWPFKIRILRYTQEHMNPDRPHIEQVAELSSIQAAELERALRRAMSSVQSMNDRRTARTGGLHVVKAPR